MKILKNERGIALMLSIMLIGIIVVLTLQFNNSMRSELHASTSLNENIRLSSVAKSGFNYALAVLSKDLSEGDFDSLLEDWADSEIMSNDARSLFEQDQLDVRIRDLSSKIQLNGLIDKDGNLDENMREVLYRLFNLEEFGIDPEKVDDMIDAIKDWIDLDDEGTRFGAENSYYQTLDSPYSCRNGPLESIEELLYIQGITKEIFYGTDENDGISKYLRVHGDVSININTAGPIVLKALSEELDDDMVAGMISYREDEENSLKEIDWYQQVPGMANITLPPELITTSSSIFEITSRGLKDDRSKTLTGIVDRDEKGFKTLSWQLY